MTWDVDALLPATWQQRDWQQTAVIVSWPDTPGYEKITPALFDRLLEARVPVIVVCDSTRKTLAMSNDGEDWLKSHTQYALQRMWVDIPSDLHMDHGLIAFRRIRVFRCSF